MSPKDPVVRNMINVVGRRAGAAIVEVSAVRLVGGICCDPISFWNGLPMNRISFSLGGGRWG